MSKLCQFSAVFSSSQCSFWRFFERDCHIQNALTHQPVPFHIKIETALSQSEQRNWDQLAQAHLPLQSSYLNALSQNTLSQNALSHTDSPHLTPTQKQGFQTKPISDVDISQAPNVDQVFRVQFFQREDLVGIAHFTLSSYVGPSIAQHLKKQSLMTRLLKRFRMSQKPLQGQVLLCGHPTLIGEQGYYFKPEVWQQPRSRQKALLSLLQACEDIINLPKTKPVSAVLFADDPHLASLEKHGFIHFQTEPKLILKQVKWENYEQYLAQLSSKYRVKMKRAYTKSAALNSKQMNAVEITQHSKKLSELYEQVRSKASLAFAPISVDKLAKLVQTYPEQVKVHVYELNHQIVGFRVSLLSDHKLIAYLVGLDYHSNREHSVYPRILNDYLQEAIELGAEQVDFGRTASEIKTTLGAQPVHSGILLQHRYPLMQCALPLIANQVSQESFKIHQPFKH